MNANPEHFEEAGRRSYGPGSEMSRFFSDVEDLLKRVAHMNDADAARLRERVEGSLAGAREVMARSAGRVRASASEMADSTDDFVHARPWTVAGIAMVAGAILGAALFSSRR